MLVDLKRLGKRRSLKDRLTASYYRGSNKAEQEAVHEMVSFTAPAFLRHFFWSSPSCLMIFLF
jgi:hypothetical protein